MTRAAGHSQLALYSGPLQCCSYLPGRQSRSWFVDPSAALTPRHYDRLLAMGYRRSGGIVYRPACPGCQACIPVRVPVEGFRLRRWARRNQILNQDLVMSWHQKGLSEEAFDLYRRYQRARHVDGEMDYSTPSEVEQFLFCDWLEPLVLEWRQEKRLVAAAVVDRTLSALSAVYSFFEPDLRQRGLGTHAILCQLTLAVRWERRWLYLGYWIKECPKMSYKSRFRPIEAFNGQEWHALK